MDTCLPTPVLAKALRVMSENKLLVSLDLAWGVCLRRVITVTNFDTASLTPQERAAAKHCLIVLAGGRKLWIHPLRSSLLDSVQAHVYVLHELCGEPVGWTQGLVDGQVAGLEIGPYLNSLRAGGFDIQRVHNDLNGKK